MMAFSLQLQLRHNISTFWKNDTDTYYKGKRLTFKMLIGCMDDSWDYIRSVSYETLSYFPSPLSGLITPATLKPLIQWTCNVIDCPR